MNVFSLILREMAYRRLNSVLAVLGVAVTVSLFVAFFTAGQGAQRETRRLMRDLGFNLRIVPGDTDLARYWARGYSRHTMPEDYVHRMARQAGLSYAHLTATLERPVSWRGRQILLTGVLPELAPPGRAQPPIAVYPAPSHARVGAAIAASAGLGPRDTLTIGGVSLVVDQVLPETGSTDDIRMYVHLHDAQRILDLRGRIGEIRALQCLCLVNGVNVDSLSVLRAQLEQVLPGTRLIRRQGIADTRERQRIMVQRFFALVMPLVVAASLVWIGVLALLNARERVAEIGILHALGHGRGRIFALFLGRAVVLGLTGAGVGYALGTWMAICMAPRVFLTTAAAVRPSSGLLVWAVFSAPALSALAALVPALWAVTRDPASILREE